MPQIPDQAAVIAQIAALTVTAKTFANVSHRLPARTSDDLADLEALESFIAQRQVVTRLQSPQPRPASPAPVCSQRAAVALPAVGCSGVKLSATDKARAALRQPVAKTAVGNHAAPATPARSLTASEKCQQALAPKPAKPVAAPANADWTPAKASSHANRIIAAAVTAGQADLMRVATNDALAGQAALRKIGVAIPTCPALTGNLAADLQVQQAYAAELVIKLATHKADRKAGDSKPRRRVMRHSKNAAGERITIVETYLGNVLESTRSAVFTVSKSGEPIMVSND